MIIIDLRPYAKNPPQKPLNELILEHYITIRGTEQIIYNLPDMILMTEEQFSNSGIAIKNWNGIPIEVKDEPNLNN